MEKVTEIALYSNIEKVDKLSIYTIRIDGETSNNFFYFKCYIKITGECGSMRDNSIKFEFGAFNTNKVFTPYAQINLNSVDIADKLKEETISKLMKDRTFFRFKNSYNMLTEAKERIMKSK